MSLHWHLFYTKNTHNDRNIIQGISCLCTFVSILHASFKSSTKIILLSDRQSQLQQHLIPKRAWSHYFLDGAWAPSMHFIRQGLSQALIVKRHCSPCCVWFRRETLSTCWPCPSPVSGREFSTVASERSFPPTSKRSTRMEPCYRCSAIIGRARLDMDSDELNRKLLRSFFASLGFRSQAHCNFFLDICCCRVL